MDIINPSAGSSKFLNRKERMLVELPGEQTNGALGSGENTDENEAIEQDEFSLSNNAKKLLSESSGLIARLLAAYPQYKHHFPDAGKLQGLGLLGRMNSFLSQAHYAKKAETDPDFATFYEDLKSLENRSRAALELMQSTLRGQVRHGYGHLKKN
ncbi:MAG: hypothetical protein CMO81_08530 [Waddliaceae bacterium]|nr:hypothetical protein [Waddliaceae bacterium]